MRFSDNSVRVGLVCVLLSAGAVALALMRPQFEADTLDLGASVVRALECLDSGVSPCRGVGAYSLQQTLIVAATTRAGVERVTIGRLLAVLSALSFALLVALFATCVPQHVRLLGLTALSTSPLVYYVKSTFGELLAAALLTVFVAIVRFAGGSAPSRLLSIGVAATLASLGKDTMPPFVLLLAAVTHLGDPTASRGDGWIRIGAAAVGALVGWSAFACFHLFRVGAVYNTDYIGRPEYTLASLLDVSSAFFGHWLSPAVGLVWWWPLSIVILVGGNRSRLGPLAIVGAYAAGLSFWWSPFGWIAWGDRLLYPILVASLFARLTSFEGQYPQRAFGRVAQVVAAVSLLPALATWAATANSTVLTVFFAPDTQFPGPPTIQSDVDLYRQFLRHLTWERLYSPAALIEPLGTVTGAAIAAVAGAATLYFLWFLASPSVSRIKTDSSIALDH